METGKETKEAGFVYVLTSPKTSYVKIGGSAYPPAKRVREINLADPYKQFEPWTLYDFKGVKDWRKIEYSIHYALRSKLVAEIVGQKELFSVSPFEAQQKLQLIDEFDLLNKPKVDRMFNDTAFRDYLLQLFKYTGLFAWIDLQGSWTLHLFTSTNWGRYFTINIDRHETAFSTLEKENERIKHTMVMDELICRYETTMQWLVERSGEIYDSPYATALSGAVNVYFEGNFHTASEFLQQDGVRRAIVAYWTESLLTMRENNRLSLFSKHHNANAVSELLKLSRNQTQA